MSLINHITVLSPQTIANDNPESFKTKANGNWSLAKSESQLIEDRVEDTFEAVLGSGLLTLPTVTISPSSLSVSFTAFTALIGVQISKAASSALVLASQAAGVLYLCNDGTWATVLPTTKSYAIVGTYVSTVSGVTSFTLSTMLIPKLVTVSGTITDLVIPADPGYADYYINHSAQATFEIPGFITLTLDNTNMFYVELLYSGDVKVGSNTLNDPPHNCTDEGFWIRVYRRGSYYYSDDENCSCSYIRTGMCLTT